MTEIIRYVTRIFTAVCERPKKEIAQPAFENIISKRFPIKVKRFETSGSKEEIILSIGCKSKAIKLRIKDIKL